MVELPGSLALVAPIFDSRELLLRVRSYKRELQLYLYLERVRASRFLFDLLLIMYAIYLFQCTKIKLYNVQNLMESPSPLPIKDSYPTYIYFFIPLLTAYFGIFVTMSNHYVLRPRIQSFLARVSLSSQLVRELIIDLLSNMSFITYSFSFYFLTSPSDNSIRLLSLHNTMWVTICLAIVAYYKISSEQAPSNIIMIKNGVLLILCCVDILYHYFTDTKSISFPFILVGLYIINLLINSNEQKFINFTLQMLGLKKDLKYQLFPKCKSNLPSVSYLSEHYPIPKAELEDRIKKYQSNIKANPKNPSHQLNSKIDTKNLVRSKLLQMALCIHMSHSKMQEQQIKNAKQYFSMSHSFGGGQRKDSNNDHQNNNDESNSKEEDRILMNNEDNEKKAEEGGEKYEQPIIKQVVQPPADSGDSIFLCIFPVKFFESHKIISTVVSIMVNVGFGLLLDFCQNLTNTLKYGSFLEIVYAALLLPMLPSISAPQYFNAMSLASIWKFGVLGLAIGMGSLRNNPSKIDWQFNNMIPFHIIVYIIVVILGVGSLVSQRINHKFLLTVFLISICIHTGLLYLRVNSL